MEKVKLFNGDEINQRTILGHPSGLFTLFFTEMWERFSYYGMRAILVLFLISSLDNEGWGWERKDALLLYAWYTGLVYITPIFGGLLADKFLGYRKAVVIGAFLMTLGHAAMALEVFYDFYLYVGLSFLILGNGFFKPNISTFVGSLYKDGDVRKDSGFTIFYMGINIGGWVAPLLCGWLAATYGWHYGFGLAGFGMLLGLVFFWNGIKRQVFGSEGLPPSQEAIDKPLLGVSQGKMIPILAFLTAPLIAFLLSSYGPFMNGETFLGDQNLVNIIFKAIGAVILFYLAKVLIDATIEERKKLIVAILITFFMTIFWGFHELSGSVITLFAARNVNLSLMDAAQTNSLNSMFIIILAIPISLMWAYLAKTKRNPRTPYKFGLGLLFAGLSFYILSISGLQADENGMVPFSYLLVMYFMLSIGELFMSPVGLSKITDLSPKRIVAFMMGIWFLSSAYAFQVVGFISKELAVESDNANVGGLETLTVYTDGFELIAMYSIGAGVLVLIASPFIKRLMGNVH